MTKRQHETDDGWKVCKAQTSASCRAKKKDGTPVRHAENPEEVRTIVEREAAEEFAEQVDYLSKKLKAGASTSHDHQETMGWQAQGIIEENETISNLKHDRMLADEDRNDQLEVARLTEEIAALEDRRELLTRHFIDHLRPDDLGDPSVYRATNQVALTVTNSMNDRYTWDDSDKLFANMKLTDPAGEVSFSSFEYAEDGTATISPVVAVRGNLSKKEAHDFATRIEPILRAKEEVSIAPERSTFYLDDKDQGEYGMYAFERHEQGWDLTYVQYGSKTTISRGNTLEDAVMDASMHCPHDADS